MTKTVKSWWVSDDEKFIAFSSDYEKFWRYSGLYNIQIFDIASGESVFETSDKVQYFEFVSANEFHNLTAVYIQHNSIRVLENVANSGFNDHEITYGGGEYIFNGRPDWVYEEEGVGSDNTVYFSDSGKVLAFVQFDTHDEKRMEIQTYSELNHSRE